MNVPAPLRTVALMLLLVPLLSGAQSKATEATTATLQVSDYHEVVFLGDSVRLRFDMNPGGDDISEIHWPIRISFSNGNTLGPIPATDIDFNASLFSRFEHVTVFGSAGTDPDTLYWYAVAGDSSGWLAGGATLATIDFYPTDTGWIHFDSTSLPSGVGLTLKDLDGIDVPFVWRPDSVYVIPVPPPSLTLELDRPYTYRDTYYVTDSIHISLRAIPRFSAHVSELRVPVQATFSENNFIGPVREGMEFVFSATAQSSFDSLYFDTARGLTVTDPDTLYFSFTQGGATGLTQFAELATLRFVPEDTGFLVLDSTTIAGLGSLVALDSLGQPIPVGWRGDSLYVGPASITVAAQPNHLGGVMYVGVNNRLIFSASSHGPAVSEFVFPIALDFTRQNPFGPLANGHNVQLQQIGWSFDSLLLDPRYGQGGNPETTLTILTSEQGTEWGGSYWRGHVWSMSCVPTDTGTFTLDTVTLPPGYNLSATDTSGASIPVTWRNPGPIRIVPVPDDLPIFDISTGMGNDTLYVGIQGSIVFSLDAASWEISAITMPLFFYFSQLNFIGPVSEAGDGVTQAQFIYSDYARQIFENRPFNPLMGTDFTDPFDSLLWGGLDFGGGGWDTTGMVEFCRITFVPTDTGSVLIDSGFLAPASGVSLLDPSAAEIPHLWNYPYVMTAVQPSIQPVNCWDVVVDAAQYVAGDLVTGSILAEDPNEFPPGPLSYYLVSADNSNGTGPTLVFQFDPAGNWSWQTQSTTQDDVGDWVVVFGVTNGRDTTWCDPVGLTVVAEQPLIRFGFECIEAFSGQDACVGLYAHDFLDPCVELGGFDLLFTYDASLLTFAGLDMTGSILDTMGWEYLTYRVVSTSPVLIRIVAIADMNNSNQHPSGYCLDGLLANVCFRTTNDRNLACQSAWLNFYWDDCGDNTASSRDGNSLYMVADPANGPWIGGNSGDGVPGGGIISACIDSTDGLIQMFTGDGGTGGLTGACCDTVIAAIDTSEQVAGGSWLWQVFRSDLNLNGLAYEIADAILYMNYFLRGDTVFREETRQQQIDVSDVNGNWLAATVEDLAWLSRVITGSQTPVAERLRGAAGVANFGPPVDVTTTHAASHSSIHAATTEEIGVAHFVLQYWGTQILDVVTAGRASHLVVVNYFDNQGELRIGLNGILQGSTVPAGSGEVLRIITSGGGQVRLVSAEVASFDAQTLQSSQLPSPLGDPFVDTTYKPCPEELLYFVNGKVQILCPGDIDDRGDLNLNAVAYEIADAVLYSNYFIQGPGVFEPGLQGEAQAAASDINADGTPLTVADLVYLIRVITGDVEPIAEDLLGGGPKVAASGQLNVISAQQGARVKVSANSEHDLGVGLFVYAYEGTEIAGVQAVGRASAMDVKYQAEGGKLRILVLPDLSQSGFHRSRIAAGSGEILSIATNGVGTVELVSVEAATFMGGTLDATVEAKILPTAYALHQNYPNPFNPSTSLAIDFPTAGKYTLTIYNIAGQVVKTFAGQAEAGTHTIRWDGVDNRGATVASGVYFYAARAASFRAVKKMVLMR